MIPLYKVHMPADVAIALSPILGSGTITEGAQAASFQKKIGEWIGNPNTVLTNSGTSAITLALRLAGVGHGDEVISTPMTCLATNEPILTAGAHPVWCDVDPNTGNMDPSRLEQLITQRTKAILFVDWAGTPAALDEINGIAARHGIKTIEDAAHSLGALYRGVKIGNHCDFQCFSFQAIKHLTTVDGGAIACRDPKDAERATLLRWFGLQRGHNKSLVCWNGDVMEPGYKMHMNDVNATIGLEQMKYIDSNISKHRANGQQLAQYLLGLKSIRTTQVPSYVDSSYWIFTVLFANSEHRAQSSAYLAQHGIGNNVTHTRNDTYSLFSPYRRQLDGLDEFSSRMLNVPCGWWVSPSDLWHIIDRLQECDY